MHISLSLFVVLTKFYLFFELSLHEGHCFIVLVLAPACHEEQARSRLVRIMA